MSHENSVDVYSKILLKSYVLSMERLGTTNSTVLKVNGSKGGARIFNVWKRKLNKRRKNKLAR